MKTISWIAVSTCLVISTTLWGAPAHAGFWGDIVTSVTGSEDAGDSVDGTIDSTNKAVGDAVDDVSNFGGAGNEQNKAESDKENARQQLESERDGTDNKADEARKMTKDNLNMALQTEESGSRIKKGKDTGASNIREQDNNTRDRVPPPGASEAAPRRSKATTRDNLSDSKRAGTNFNNVPRMQRDIKRAERQTRAQSAPNRSGSSEKRQRDIRRTRTIDNVRSRTGR